MGNLNSNSTHDIVKNLLDRIDILMATVSEQALIIADLTAANEKLTEEVRSLKEQLKKNSKNSSKPPSSDGLNKPNPKSLRKTSGKLPGAQKGHEGNGFKLVKTPDETIQHKPNQCVGCQNSGQCNACPTTETRYEIDIRVDTKVTAHQVLSYECPYRNGEVLSGAFPSNITSTMQYGNNLEALVIALNTAGMMSIKRTHDILSAVFGVPICTGTIFAMVKDCACKLIHTVERIKETVIQLPVVHFDETGLRVDKKLHWLHSASDAAFTYLSVETKRGTEGMNSSDVLSSYSGIAVHDCWMPYFKYPNIVHALCNAHLLRELISVTENHPTQTWSEQMLDLILEMKKIRDRFVDSGKENLTYYYLHGFSKAYDAIIEEARMQNPIIAKVPGKRGRPKKGKVLALAERLATHKAAVCLFTKNFYVPFDNNQAERDIRMIKVKIKVSGCFRKKEGADTFATIMSYISTANKHGINTFIAIKNALEGQSESMIFA